MGEKQNECGIWKMFNFDNAFWLLTYFETTGKKIFSIRCCEYHEKMIVIEYLAFDTNKHINCGCIVFCVYACCVGKKMPK